MNRITDLVKTSPVFLVSKLVIFLFNKSKSFIKSRKKKPVYKSPEIQEVISTIKETKSSGDKSSFIADFKYPLENKKGDRRNTPMELTPRNKELISKSIVISPYDTELSHRTDLEFIGNSRITGRGIYRYVGNDFSKFELPYEEIISLDTKFEPITEPYIPQRLPVIDEELKRMQDYCDYVAENLDKNIAYSNYISELYE
jgi:hypothetical protein